MTCWCVCRLDAGATSVQAVSWYDITHNILLIRWFPWAQDQKYPQSCLLWELEAFRQKDQINCLDVRTSLFKFLAVCLGGFDMIWSRFLPSVPDVRQNWFCCYVLAFVGHFCILSYSLHMYFFSSTQPMIPVNSCGAATIITPSTVKPRKARRLMGQSVDRARWGDLKVSNALI